MSRSWVWVFGVVCVECKRVVKEGYPALWRALAALLVIELGPEPREGSKAPSYRRGANSSQLSAAGPDLISILGEWA